ncbi:MAG: hypothetical protein RL721_1545, partial [Candidatus Eisenbacteria bacterium]
RQALADRGRMAVRYARIAPGNGQVGATLMGGPDLRLTGVR